MFPWTVACFLFFYFSIFSLSKFHVSLSKQTRSVYFFGWKQEIWFWRYGLEFPESLDRALVDISSSFVDFPRWNFSKDLGYDSGDILSMRSVVDGILRSIS